MNITLMELLLILETYQEIVIYKDNLSLTVQSSTVGAVIEKDYYGYYNNIVDCIKPKKYGGLLGYKEKLVIEIHLE